MKYFYLTILLFVFFLSGKGQSIDYQVWKNKSPLGINVRYDYRNFKTKTTELFYAIGFPTEYFDGYPETTTPRSVDVRPVNTTQHVVRLQPDYWIFPFLNIYGIGGKVYSNNKTTYDISVLDSRHLELKMKDDSDGWEYGFGGKVAYFYKGFEPQLNYTMFWTHFDAISDNQRFQELNLNLSYCFNRSHRWFTNITLQAGVSYTQAKFKERYSALFNPSGRVDLSNPDDITLILFLATGVNVSYDGTTFVPQDELSAKRFQEWLDRRLENGFTSMDAFSIMYSMDSIKEVGLNLGIEAEVYNKIYWHFNANILGKTRSVISTGISYRLFGKDKRL